MSQKKAALFVLLISPLVVWAGDNTAAQPAGEYCAVVKNQIMNLTLRHAQFKVRIDQLSKEASGCHCVKGVLSFTKETLEGKASEAYFSSVQSAVPSTKGCGQ